MACDFEMLQVDAANKLNAEFLFREINVKYARKMVIDRELDESLVFLTAKNGKRGCGVLVGMPSLRVSDPNVPGPKADLILPFRVFENRQINMASASGTLVSAETAGFRVMEVFNHWQPFPWACFRFGNDAMQPFKGPDGIVSYEMVAETPLVSSGVPQVPLPALSQDPGDPLTVTLTPDESQGPEGQFVFYTTDESFPGDYSGTTAQMYTQPFRVAPGTVVRWAAYKVTDVAAIVWRGSHGGWQVITEGLLAPESGSGGGHILGPEGGGVLG